MPVLSTADVRSPTEFPVELGEPIWRERRTFPVGAVYGVPTAFLAALAVGVGPVAAHVAFAAATMVMIVLLARARRRALIEVYTVSERFVAIEQPRGGRVAIPNATLTRVIVKGDVVRLESTAAVITLGFVRRRRALLRALAAVAPDVRVDHDVAFCPT